MQNIFTLYGGPFAGSFLVTLFFLSTLLFVGRFIRLPGRVVSSTDKGSKPRIGGWALGVSFIVAILALPFLALPEEWWVFGGVLVGGILLGIVDDYKTLSWKTQLFGQIGLLAFLYSGGIHIFSLTHPAGGVWLVPNGGILSFGFFLFLIWGVTVINALNWLDGVDGLLGGVSLVTYLTFFLLALGGVVNQPPIAVAAIVLAGITSAFLIYNFPPARLFAGTAGVLFFGLTITFLSVVAGTKIATILLVLALPILDTAFVVLKRLQAHKSVVEGDKSHLHYVLLARGWRPERVIIFYGGISSFLALLSLQTAVLGKLTALITGGTSLMLLLTYFHFPQAFHRWKFVTCGVGAGILFLVATGYFWFRVPVEVVIDGKSYVLERVTTTATQAKGLSGRAALEENKAMFFIFPESKVQRFWMKDMQFSIDVLWLDENNRVVAKDEQLPFPSLQPFGPDIPVKSVLELPAGSTRAVDVGEKVYFQYGISLEKE